MQPLLRAALAFVGLANLGYGAWALAMPVAAVDLAGLTTTTPAGVGELRAVFGGLVTALGGLVLWCASGRAPRAVAATLAGLFAGLVAGRALSLVVDGWATYTGVALVLEAGMAAVLGAAARSACRATAPP